MLLNQCVGARKQTGGSSDDVSVRALPEVTIYIPASQSQRFAMHKSDSDCVSLCLCVCLFVPQIYTDWANYYLERAKSKKRVVDLSGDFRDGLLLADVIEAVTSFKVPDLAKKPKTKQQMVCTRDDVSCMHLIFELSETTHEICIETNHTFA